MSRSYKTTQIYEYLKRNPNSTSRDVSDATGIDHKYCNTFIHKLWSDGYLTKIRGAGTWFNPRKFSVSDKEPPRLGCGPVVGVRATKRFKKKARQKLWNNMKIERQFSISSILATIDVPKTTAYSYLNQLIKSGYVELISCGKKKRKVKKGTAENRYSLVRDTGRLSPIGRKDGCWDQNEQKLYPFTATENSEKEGSHDMVR